jgi:hypothetical protein
MPCASNLTLESIDVAIKVTEGVVGDPGIGVVIK